MTTRQSISLKKTVSVMESHSDINIVYSESEAVDEKGCLFEKDFFLKIHSEIDPEKWTESYVNSGHDEILNSLFIKNTIPNASAVLFRKTALLNAGIADNTLVLSGDWLAYIRVLEKENSRIAYVNEKLNCNRIHRKRVTSRSNISSVYFGESRKVAEYLAEKYEIPEESKILYLKNYLNQYFINCCDYSLSEIDLISLENIFGQELLFKVLSSFVNEKCFEYMRVNKSVTERLKRLTFKKLLKKILRNFT